MKKSFSNFKKIFLLMMSAIFSRSGTETLMNRRVTKKNSLQYFSNLEPNKTPPLFLNAICRSITLIVSIFFIFKNRIEKYPKCIFIRPDLNKNLRKIQIMACITFFSIDAD